MGWFVDQLKCLICGTPFRFCCSILPDMNESTSTRFVYTTLLILGTFGCVIMMSPFLLDEWLYPVAPRLPDFKALKTASTTKLTTTTTTTTTPFPAAQIVEKFDWEYFKNWAARMNLTNFNLFSSDWPSTPADCKDEFGVSKCSTFSGPTAVYRFTFAMVLFFLFLFLITIKVSSSISVRGRIHNGFWLWKALFLVFLLSLSFKIPLTEEIKTVWMYVGIVGATIYIIINLLLLIELSYSWTEKILNKKRCKFFWHLILIVLTLVFMSLTVVLTIYLYKSFVPNKNCSWNNLLVSTVLGSCFIFFIFAIYVAAKTKKAYVYLLPTAFVSAYVMLLTWSTLVSIPVEYSSLSLDGAASNWCHSDPSTVHIDQRFITYLVIALTLFLNVYTSIKSTKGFKVFGIEINKPEDKSSSCCSWLTCCCRYFVNTGSTEKLDEKKQSGQRIIRNEKTGVTYSYSFFHFIFLLACLHNMMNFTNWTRPETASLQNFGKSMPSVYAKAFSTISCVLLFGCTLMISCFFPSKKPSKQKQDIYHSKRSITTTTRCPTYARHNYNYRHDLDLSFEV